MGALSTYYKLRMANPQVQLSGETPAVQIPVEDENTSYSTSSGITDTHKGWIDAINGKNAVVIPEETPAVQPSVQTTNPNAYKAEQIAAAQRNITEQPRVVNQPQQPEKQRNYPSSSQSAAVQRTVSQTPVQKQPAQKMGGNPYVRANQQQQRYQIDTKDPINSLAAQLVTPAEREAMEMRLLRNKRRMIAWTGLFDGLRQLGNLYFTTKGATPQQFTDKPYQQIEADYQAEMKRQDNLAKNRENYAKQLWNLKRQGVEDARKKALADAQVKWYDDRAEIAQQKAELEKLKSVRVIKQKDGSLLKFDPVSGSIEPLTEADPLYVDYMKSRINATNKRAGLIGAPVTTVTTDEKGKTKTSVRSFGNNKTERNSKSSSGAGKYSKYKKGSTTGGSGSSGKYDKYKKSKK